MKRTNVFVLVTAALAAGATNLLAQEPSVPATPYMDGPVELVTAPNGAIANKRILDGIGKVAWLEPTIEQPVEDIWVFVGYGLAPIAVIDTDQGLIAFDTGDTRHDGELLLAAIRAVAALPVTFVDYFRVRIDPVKSGDTDRVLRFDFADGKSAGLHVRRAVAEYIGDPDAHPRKPDIVMKRSGAAWAKVYLSAAPVEALIKSGEITLTAGDAAVAARVLDSFDRYEPARAVVVPSASLVQDHM